MKHLLALTVAASAIALSSGASAQDQTTVVTWTAQELSRVPLGTTSTLQIADGLVVGLMPTRVGVNGSNLELCGIFRNVEDEPWIGAYRITSRNDRTTFAALTVPSGRDSHTGTSQVDRCEIVAPGSTYSIVVNKRD